jgi:hypothetical protein
MKTSSKYRHGVRCLDCSRVLTDTEIFRRLVDQPKITARSGWCPENVEPVRLNVYELICESCLLRGG